MGSFGSPAVDRLERLRSDAFAGRELRRPGRWAVAFLAEWCPFCRAFGPAFAELNGGTAPAHLAVGDVTSEESPLWDTFALEVVPTVLVFEDGGEVARFDGRSGEGLGPRDLAEIRRRLAAG